MVFLSPFQPRPGHPGCSFPIQHPHPLSSRTRSAGPRPPFWTAPAGGQRHGEGTVTERGLGFWGSPQMQEFPVLFGHCPGKRAREQSPRGAPWLSARLDAPKIRERRWGGQGSSRSTDRGSVVDVF